MYNIVVPHRIEDTDNKKNIPMKKARKTVKAKIQSQYRPKLNDKISVKKKRISVRDIARKIRPLNDTEKILLAKSLRKIEKGVIYDKGLNRIVGGWAKAEMTDSDKEAIDVTLTYGVSGGGKFNEEKFQLDRKTMERIYADGGKTKDDNGKYQVNDHGDKPTDYKIICRIIRTGGKDVQVCYHETNDHKAKVVQIYSGKNYIVGSNDVSYSRKYDEVSEVPVKYKAVVDELIAAHHKKWNCGCSMEKGKNIDKETNFHLEVKDWIRENTPDKYHNTSLDEIPDAIFTPKQRQEKKNLLYRFESEAYSKGGSMSKGGKTVYNVTFFDKDGEELDNTQVDEKDEKLAWDLFKEFGHDKKPGMYLEWEKTTEEMEKGGKATSKLEIEERASGYWVTDGEGLAEGPFNTRNKAQKFIDDFNPKDYMVKGGKIDGGYTFEIKDVKEYNSTASPMMKFYKEGDEGGEERKTGYVLNWKHEQGGSGARFYRTMDELTKAKNKMASKKSEGGYTADGRSGEYAKGGMVVYLDGKKADTFKTKKALYEFVKKQESTGVKKVEIDYGNRIIPTFDTYVIEDGRLIHKGELIQPKIDKAEVERKRLETERSINEALQRSSSGGSMATGGEVGDRWSIYSKHTGKRLLDVERFKDVFRYWPSSHIDEMDKELFNEIGLRGNDFTSIDTGIELLKRAQSNEWLSIEGKTVMATGGEVSNRKEYEEYLNEIGEALDEDSQQWIIGGKNRYKNSNGQYGSALKKYDPIAFNTGYANDWKSSSRSMSAGGKSNKMVVEVLYRDGANYKNEYLFDLPEGKTLKVGDEVPSTIFGISEQEWYDNYLPGEYDSEIDHNLLEVLEIRPKGKGDIISKKKSSGGSMEAGGKTGEVKYHINRPLTDYEVAYLQTHGVSSDETYWDDSDEENNILTLTTTPGVKDKTGSDIQAIFEDALGNKKEYKGTVVRKMQQGGSIIQKEDVLSVARQIKKELTPDEIEEVLKRYPSEQKADEEATWDLVVENVIYRVINERENKSKGGSMKSQGEIKGRGYAGYKKGRELFPEDVKNLKVGDIILNETTWFGGITRNALKVVGLADYPNKIGDIIYVEFLTHKNPDAHAIWARGFGGPIEGKFWRAEKKEYGGDIEMEAGGDIKEGKNGYVAFYKGKQMDVWGDTLLQARDKAAAAFKAKKAYDVTVVLAEKDGEQVTHVPLFEKGGKTSGGSEYLVAQTVSGEGYSSPEFKIFSDHDKADKFVQKKIKDEFPESEAKKKGDDYSIEVSGDEMGGNENDSDYHRIQILKVPAGKFHLIHYYEPNEVDVTSYTMHKDARKTMDKELKSTIWEDGDEWDEYWNNSDRGDSFGAHADDGYEHYEIVSMKKHDGGGGLEYSKGGKLKVGDYVSLDLSSGKHYGKILGDYTDKFYIGHQYGYEVEGIGDRIEPERLHRATKAEYDQYKPEYQQRMSDTYGDTYVVAYEKLHDGKPGDTAYKYEMRGRSEADVRSRFEKRRPKTKVLSVGKRYSRGGKLENLRSLIKKELEAHKDEAYYASEADEQNSKKIYDIAKSDFGYEVDEDEVDRDYLLKATPEETWQYWLDVILPKLQNKKDMGGILLATAIGAAIGGAAGYGYRDNISSARENAIKKSIEKKQQAIEALEKRKAKIRSYKEKVKSSAISQIQRLEKGGLVFMKGSEFGGQQYYTIGKYDEEKALYNSEEVALLKEGYSIELELRAARHSKEKLEGFLEDTKKEYPNAKLVFSDNEFGGNWRIYVNKNSMAEGGNVKDIPILKHDATWNDVKDYLAWLGKSPYAYHIDDNPFDIDNFSPEEQNILKSNSDIMWKFSDDGGKGTKLWDVYYPATGGDEGIQERLAMEKGGNMANKKVGKVMHEFKHGELKSHGKTVTDRDQAIAIAMSESGQSRKQHGGYAKGGDVKSKLNAIEKELNEKGVFLKHFDERGVAANATFEGYDIEEYDYEDEHGERHELSKDIQALIDDYNYTGGLI